MDRNTSPISPFTKKDYEKAYENTFPHLYPEDEIQRFKNIYGKINNFRPDEIELANGSDEWLQKLMLTLGHDGVMTLNPDFNMYEEYAGQVDVPCYQIDSNEYFIFDFDEIINEIKEKRPSLFILSNPHNPTSILFSERNLNRISEAMSSVNGYFVIDEAYTEFAVDYDRPQGDHVIILRTMSKIYGMAGLRIGIINAKNETFKKLISINHPYPLNNLNLNLAADFLENKEKLDTFTSYQIESRDKLAEIFQVVQNKVHIKQPSFTNFVFTYGENAKDLGLFLKEKGFSGRFYNEDHLNDAVRYSIIELDKYPELKNALEEWESNQ